MIDCLPRSFFLFLVIVNNNNLSLFIAIKIFITKGGG
jgi:hypothetical protein